MSADDVLKEPSDRRGAWAVISHMLWHEAWRRPWRRVRWRAWWQAANYSTALDPPREWPNGIPYDWADWR